MYKKNSLQLVRLVENEHMTIGLWIKDMDIDKHKFCMEVLNKGKVATQSQSNFDCLVKKEEHEQTINTEHCKNEFYITLEETFGGHLKRRATGY